MAGYSYQHYEDAFIYKFLTEKFGNQYGPSDPEYQKTLELIQNITIPTHEHVVSWWNNEGGGIFPDEKVKMVSTDPISGYLFDKVDDITIKYNPITFKLYVDSIPLASNIKIGGIIVGVNADSILYMQESELLVRVQTSPNLSSVDNEVPSSRAVKLYVDAAIQGTGGGSGVGDMLKSTYDINNNAVVDDSEKLNNQLPEYYLNWNNFTNKPLTYTPSPHILVSSDHTVSGLTTGHFLKALSANTFGFAAHGLTYDDVGAAPYRHSHTDNILDWDSGSNWYAPYAIQQSGGKFDLSSTAPIHFPFRLNYDGDFYVSSVISTGYVQTNAGGAYTSLYGESQIGYLLTWNPTLKIRLHDNSMFELNHTNINHQLYINRIAYNGTADVIYDVINILDNPTTSGIVGGSIFKATIVSTTRINFNPRVATGSNAIAYIFDTHNNLNTSGDKLLSIRNQNSEKFYIDKDGEVYANGVHLGAGGNVSNTGTPVDNQLAVWTNATTIEGSTSLIFITSLGNILEVVRASGTNAMAIIRASVDPTTDTSEKSSFQLKVNNVTSELTYFGSNYGVTQLAGNLVLTHPTASNGTLNLVCSNGVRIGNDIYYDPSQLIVYNTYVELGVPIYTLASSTSVAGLRFPHGLAPTSPVNGDIWTTTIGLYVRIGGVTVGPLGTGSGGGVTLSGSTNNTICTVTGANVIQGEANLTFDGSDLSITGTIHSTGNITATDFCLSSDERLKTNIISYQPEFIDIDYKQFELKTNLGQKRYGIIAQELQKKHPELVREESDGSLSISLIDLLIRKIAYLESKLNN